MAGAAVLALLLPLLLLAILICSHGVKAFFIGPSGYMSRNRYGRTTTYDKIASSSTEEMTTSDEEILFGESVNSDPSSAGRTAMNPPFPARHRHISLTGNLLEATNLPINPLDHSTKDPLINALRKTRDTITSCPSLWENCAKLCGDQRAVFDEHLCDEIVDLTFAEISNEIRTSASAFVDLGVEKGVNVALFAENCAKWLIADQGLQLAGGVSVVRGSDTPSEELRYIYAHSDCKRIALIQSVKLLKRLEKDAKKSNLSGLGLTNDTFGDVATIVLLHRENSSDNELLELAQRLGVKIYVFSDLLEKTTPLPKHQLPRLVKEDLSTIVYTSGTTGRPKGVMLTHGNLLHQIGHRLSPTTQYDESEPLPGELTVALLPVWHITERTFELWMFSRGCHVVYSTVRTFKNDLAKHKPQWMVLVPRVLEKIAVGVQLKFSSGSPMVKKLAKLFTFTGNVAAHHSKITKDLVVGDEAKRPANKIMSAAIVAGLAPVNAVGNKLLWSKVRDGFGGRIKTIICGGSALSGSLETFFETCGINICVGYGLTECSPLLAFRRMDSNLVTAGCIGKPTSDTELRIVDPDIKPNFSERQPLPDGHVGVVIARGPQVMKGYYKNPEATNKVLDSYGWFDTGDLGRVNPATGDIILTGRCKDTIVLSNGENVEPVPIEDAILSHSLMIEQVMLTGQDKRGLVAIVVLNPEQVSLAGFLDASVGAQLMKHYDQINNPQFTEGDCEESCAALEKASEELRSNISLLKAIEQDVNKATASFRKWEQVSQIYLTFEPFAMANGLLTQSYKVKRDLVLKKYERCF